MRSFSIVSILLLLVLDSHLIEGGSGYSKSPSASFVTKKKKHHKDVSSLISSTDLSATTSASTAALDISRGGDDDDDENGGLMQRLKIGFYFGLWYALNVIYNIVNKKVLNVLPAPLTIGAIQFGVGALYVALLWILGLRSKPALTKYGYKVTNHIGFCHCSGQLFSMISLGAGPVSFTHIVKALEPFFSAMVSGLIFGKWMKIQVYLTLIPVVGGVGYACLKERSFSWLAFNTAMGSNLAFALRAVLSKSAMGPGSVVGTNISSTNMFGLVTIAAFIFSIPIAIVAEGSQFKDLLAILLNTAAKTTGGGASSGEGDTIINETVSAAAAAASGDSSYTRKLVQSVILSGLFHYLNNEVMYLALGNVHPVTLAVGNTMKRVFIMVASVMVFRNPISVQAGIGSAIGISGVLLYSLTKQYYENLAKLEAAKEK